jgi:uncharacterized protein
MSDPALRIERVAGTYAVCRLAPGADPGPRPEGAALYGITWTEQETSIVCPSDEAPDGARVEGPFTALRVAGTLDFSLTGVLAGLTAALAGGGISVFALSTYDTDYLLVPQDELGPAAERLREAGHEVSV